MRWQKSGVAFLLGMTCLLLSQLSLAMDDQQAHEIVDHVDTILRKNSSSGQVRMEISTENWRRTLTMHIWSRGREDALVRITQPSKEAGTATLKVKENLWTYLPKVNRTIKIPTSMMMASWMGSHFTNDDLVKESRLIRDYVVITSFEGERGGVQVYEYTLTPKPDAVVVWGKIIIEVHQADRMPRWERYYDEDGKLIRELTFSDYKIIDGELVPTRLIMRPADKAGEQTTILYDDIVFNVEISDDTFSLPNLAR